MIDGTAPAVRRAARRVRWRERVFHVAARLSPRGEPGDDRWYTGALILLYHRVVGDRDRSDDPFAVSRSRFEAQLDWLASRFQLASVGTVADRLVAGAGRVAMQLWRRKSLYQKCGYYAGRRFFGYCICGSVHSGINSRLCKG